MKDITATDVYNQARHQLKLGVKGKRLYIRNNNEWCCISNNEIPILVRSLYSKELQGEISTKCITEAIDRIMQTPDLQITFVEEKEENYLNLKNGIFDVKKAKLLQKSDKFQFGYSLDFEYKEFEQRESYNFDLYCKTSFPNETLQKRKLLLQILGYVLSDYKKAKKGFFFIGESNSGKSVLLELLKKILPVHSVTAIPLYELSNRFSLARLSESRVNISTELSAKSFKALDIFKMLTSNETVTAEYKGKTSFEFELRCKTINAGNLLPDLNDLEGMDAMLQRMCILLFPISIAKEKQDVNLLDNLYKERDAIFSEAVDELVELVKNKFVFEEPNDTKKLKQQLVTRGNAFDEFLADCCEVAPEKKEHLLNLYHGFEVFCYENLLDVKLTKTQFAQKVAKLPYVERGKFRIEGSRPLHGFKGIALKKALEYKGQDSETYSQNNDDSENSSIDK